MSAHLTLGGFGKIDVAWKSHAPFILPEAVSFFEIGRISGRVEAWWKSFSSRRTVNWAEQFGIGQIWDPDQIEWRTPRVPRVAAFESWETQLSNGAAFVTRDVH